MHDLIVTTSFANPDVAGTLGTVTVTAKDLYGNTAGSGLNDYQGTVKLTSTDATAGRIAGEPRCSPRLTAGSYTFEQVVEKTAGSQTITAFDSISSRDHGKWRGERRRRHGLRNWS